MQDQILLESCSKAVYKSVWHIPLLSVQWINSWWWTQELSETCRVSCQNKFVKLVPLFGFIIKNSWSVVTAIHEPHLRVVTCGGGFRHCLWRVKWMAWVWMLTSRVCTTIIIVSVSIGYVYLNKERTAPDCQDFGRLCVELMMKTTTDVHTRTLY